MKMDIISNLTETIQKYVHSDENHALLLQSARRASDERKAMLTAIEERIVREQQRDAAEIAKIEKQINDPSRPNSVKRLLRDQILDLQQREYHISISERNAFYAMMDELGKITRDVAQTTGECENLIRQMEKQFEELRATTARRYVHVNGDEQWRGEFNLYKRLEDKYGVEPQ